MLLPHRQTPNHTLRPINWIAALWLLLFLGGAFGAPASPKSETDWSNAPPDELIAVVRGKLAAITEAMAQAKLQTGKTVLEGVATPVELSEFEYLQHQLTRIYQRQLDGLSRLNSLRQAHAQLEREVSRWTGMATPPPYSFLLVDDLREAVSFQGTHVKSLQAMDAALTEEAVRRGDAFEETSEKLRQANERLEGKMDGNPRLIWLRDLEAQRNRVAEARVEGIHIEQRASHEEMADARQQLDFKERQLGLVKRQIAYTAADKEKVLAILATERQHLQAEMDGLMPIIEASRQAVDAAAAALAANDSGRGSDDLTNELERRSELAENADIKFQMLNRLIDSTKMREKIWELRWSTVSAKDPMEIRQAYRVIAKQETEIKPLRDYLQQLLKLAGEQLFNVEKQLLDASSATLNAHRQSMREIFAERETSYQRMFSGFERIERLLDFWKQDLDDRHEAQPLAEQAKEWWGQVCEGAALLWQFEIFAVQDTIEVEGEQITGKRSVTIGKVMTALSILVVGLWVSFKLTRFTEHVAVTRTGMDAGAARITRRWVMFLIGLALLMTSLVMVKIPLTVFAFTGGAVAIGAGFGMQNLLKNLISGLMLLLERPFRPGDLVEVAGVRGRVIDIGMRSSQFRDSNGIETLIPNSTFVEENVTNWTLSNQSVRIVVKLGIAYGSPVQQVTELLLETANRHGLVQAKPAPHVLFEDFGSDALIFGLYVWVEIKLGVDWRNIASDLRYMINKAFSEHGIVMAFPQRDVHVDTSKPLQVRLLAEGQKPEG